MEYGCFEVLVDGLTFAKKVWAKGEVISAESVPAKVKDVWLSPARQQEVYKRVIVRPRPVGFISFVEETVVSPLGTVELAGSGIAGPTLVGTSQPALGANAEVGLVGRQKRV